MDYQMLLAQMASQEEQRTWSTQRRLHAALRSAIQQGMLPAGSRLLSSRALAQELGIARNTVVYAYEQLATEGFLSSDRRGSIVSQIATNFTPSSHSAPSQLARRAREIRPLPVAAHLASGFAPGVPSLADFPLHAWRRLLDHTWRKLSAAQLGYAEAAGEPALRTAIANYLRASRGVDCATEQVFITDGTQSSLDLCAHAFAEENDTVWIENPGYGGALAAFRMAQLNLVGIEVDEQGIAPRASDWQQHPPKFIYVTPSHQYPTGGVLGLARRIHLIEQAQAHAALIIEDDYDSEFRYAGPPLAAMQGLLPNAPVVYLGTFSKTMFPAMRIGYMVVPRNFVDAFNKLLAVSTSRGRSAEQLCLAEFIRTGQFGLHLRRMRRLYQQRRDALVNALQQQLADIGAVHGDSAGMHLAFCLHNAQHDDNALSAMALAHNIVCPSFSKHAISENAWRGLVLGYAQIPQEQMAPLVARMAQLIRQSL